MRIGTGPFVVSLMFVAFAAAASGVALDARPLLWCAIVVGAYVIHLMAVHEVARTAEKLSPRAVARAEQSALETEREEVERLRRQLERKLAQAEEQWTLLRSMVQERLKGTAGPAPSESKPGTEAEEDSGHQASADRMTRTAPDLDDSSRAYGRW